MTAPQIPPLVSTRIDISDQPVTRTDLLALLAAYTKADAIRVIAAIYRNDSPAEADEYLASFDACINAHNALLAGIFSLDISA